MYFYQLRKNYFDFVFWNAALPLNLTWIQKMNENTKNRVRQPWKLTDSFYLGWGGAKEEKPLGCPESHNF